MLGHKNLAWVAQVFFHVAEISTSVGAYVYAGVSNYLRHSTQSQPACMIRCLVLMRLTINWNFICIVGNLGDIFFNNNRPINY